MLFVEGQLAWKGAEAFLGPVLGLLNMRFPPEMFVTEFLAACFRLIVLVWYLDGSSRLGC